MFKDCDTVCTPHIVSILYSNTEIVESTKSLLDTLEGEFPLIATYEFQSGSYSMKYTKDQYEKGKHTYDCGRILTTFGNDPTPKERKDHVVSLFHIIHQEGHDVLLLHMKDPLPDALRNELAIYAGAVKKILLVNG